MGPDKETAVPLAVLRPVNDMVPVPELVTVEVTEVVIVPVVPFPVFPAVKFKAPDEVFLKLIPALKVMLPLALTPLNRLTVPLPLFVKEPEKPIPLFWEVSTEVPVYEILVAGMVKLEEAVIIRGPTPPEKLILGPEIVIELAVF